MKFNLSIAVLFSLALLVFGCTPAAEEPVTEAPTQAEDIAAITSTFDECIAAVHAGDAAALAAYYTEDAVVMNPHQPTHIGKEALLQNIHDLFDPFAVKMTAQTEEIKVAGDWGFTRLSFTWTLTPKAGGEPNEDSGNWLMIWRRGPDGSWKVAREIWNSDRPLPGTEE